MDPRKLPATEGKRRFGRRNGDAGLRPHLYAATFVAHVAGLSMPRDRAPASYAISEPHPPKGLVADRKA
jgi:hypothetical protein